MTRHSISIGRDHIHGYRGLTIAKKIDLWTPGSQVICMSGQSAEQSILHGIHSGDRLMEGGTVESSPVRHANRETA